jgi:hypothetical protein
MSSNPYATPDHHTEPGQPMILVESRDRWCLARRPDPRLTVGTVFQVDGETWVVTWDSGCGFGDALVS